jgi:hypothetical protein
MHPSALVEVAYFNDLRPWLVIASMFTGMMGAVWLMYAFPAYRKKQEIADTPVSRCDAAAVGKIAIAGTAHAERLYPALFSGSSCTFCRCRISRREPAGKQSSWLEVATITSPPHPSFILADDSGEITVLAENAELRVSPRVYICGMVDPQQSLLLQSMSAAQSGLDILERYGSLSSNLYRIEERRVDVGAQLYIYGVAAEPALLPDDVRRAAYTLPKNRLVVWQGTEKSDFLITDESRSSTISQLDALALGIFFGPLLFALGAGAFAYLFHLSLSHHY